MKTEADNQLKGRRLLIATSGSIAAVKIPTLVSKLAKLGAEVRCIVTPSAARLVSPIALASLSRNRCYQDEDQWSSKEPRPLHIALAEWPEIVIVAPLSASSLARWSHGLADGLLASVLLACEKPIIAAAAMNTSMWTNESVQNNWNELINRPKILALPPESGLLACDRDGEGKMVAEDLIELSIKSALIHMDKDGNLRKDWQGKRILVSAGPTIEALDPARNITNRSTGQMGVLIAQAARFRGATVDLVHGPLQLPPGWLQGINSYQVNDSVEMQSVISNLQPKANAVAMTAAVSDFRAKGGRNPKKLKKQELLSSFEKNLEETPDLLQEIVSRRDPGQIVLGFAALTGDDAEIKKLGEAKREKKGCNLLMANPIDRPNQGFGEYFNEGWLIGDGDLSRQIPRKSKLSLAHELLDTILEQQI